MRRLFVENAPASLALFDRDMRYLHVSRRYEEVHRRDRSELVGRRYPEVFPDMPARWKEAWTRCLAGNVETALEDPFPRADGTVDYVDWEMVPWRDDDGEIAGLLLISDVVTERTPRAPEHRWVATLDALPLAAVVATLDDGRIVDANPAFERLLGRTRDEVIGESSLSLGAYVDPEDRAIAVRNVRATGKSLVEGLRIRRKDGSVRIVDGNAARTVVDGADCVVSILEDVTDARRAAEALREEQAELRAAFELAPVGIVYGDMGSGHRTAVNERFAEMLGRSKEAVLSGSLNGFTHPDDVHLDVAAQGRMTRGETMSERYEKRFVRADGTVRWADVHAAWAPRPHGKGKRFIVAVDDITEKRRAATAAREAETRWTATIAASPLAISVSTTDTGVILDVNPAFEQLFGFARDEVLGKSSRELGLLAVPEQRVPFVEHLRATGRASHPDTRIRTKAGEERVAALYAAALEGPGVPCFVTVIEDVTEKHRVEEALRAQALATRTAFDAAPVGISIGLAGDDRFSDVNVRLCDMLGYSRDELVEMSIVELAHPDDRARVAAAHTKLALGDGDEVRLSARLVRKDARVIEADVHAVAPPPFPGEARRVICAVSDATEQRRAERLVREAEQRWSATVEAAHVATSITGLDGRIIDINPATERLFGYTREEALGRTVVELGLYVNPRDREAIAAALQREGSIEQREVLVRTKSGETRWCELSSALFHLGEEKAYVTVASDVTERRKINDALAASEARHRELLESLEDTILSTDLDGVITYANPAVARFGYAPEELVGRKVDDVLPPEDEGAVRQGRAVVTGGAPAVRERAFVDKARHLHPVRHIARPQLRDGNVVGLTSIVTDLTAQRAAEEQLRVAQRMEAIGRLAGGVAHDFNNLLAVILSLAELSTAEVPDDSPTRESLDEITLAARRAEGLTRQLLAFSRKQVMVLEPLSIADVVVGVSKMLRRLIGEDIALSVQVADDLPLVKADRGQLEQVLMNLAVNSRDAMPDGGTLAIDGRTIPLDASTAASLELAEGDFVRLSVTDDGCGMDEATRARVFEPFFTTKGVGKGTGLGLATVYGIVKQLGGAVVVESTPGKGSCFHLYFPTASEDSSPPESQGRRAVSHAPRGSECILVVEDDAALRRVVQRLLSSAGYRVIACATPAEALDVCRVHGGTIDLVLTDVVMPGMNGRELARRIEEIVPSARVVYMSGYTDDAIERLDVMRFRFVRKPFANDDLLRRVREVLDEDATAPSKR